MIGTLKRKFAIRRPRTIKQVLQIEDPAPYQVIPVATGRYVQNEKVDAVKRLPLSCRHIACHAVSVHHHR